MANILALLAIAGGINMAYNTAAFKAVSYNMQISWI